MFSEMETTCSDAVAVAHNQQIGRHYVARMAVAPGETLMEEQPLFVAPHWQADQMKCSNCMLDSFVMCRKCQVFPLCIDCTTHAAYDCEFFACGAGAGISKNLLVENYAIYAALKLLLLLENPQTRSQCVPLLSWADAHCDDNDNNNSPEQAERAEQVVAPLLQAGMAAALQSVRVEAALLQRLCNAIDAHAFEVTKEDALIRAVYVGAAQLPHCCAPNAVVAVNEDFHMRIYAALPLAAGDVIYNCYANPLLGTAARQQHLLRARCTACGCARCRDPAELGAHTSTLKCGTCDGGWALPDASGDWTCAACQATMPGDGVRQLLATVSDALASLDDDDLAGYERLLAQQATHFHPHHYVIVELKQQLAALLRACTAHQPCSKLLLRRQQLCEELLPAVRAAVPGISKLYAIALYEYLLALRQCSVWEFRQQQIDESCYVRQLQRAKQTAAEALAQLQYESPNSAEGQLAQRVALEQQHIEQQLRKFSVKDL